MSKTWHTKAHRIIAELCRVAYEKANRLSTGRMRKRHVPYSVPGDADMLIECLAENDEKRAKSYFVHEYHG